MRLPENASTKHLVHVDDDDTSHLALIVISGTLLTLALPHPNKARQRKPKSGDLLHAWSIVATMLAAL